MSSSIITAALNLLPPETVSSSESSDDEIIHMLIEDSDGEEDLILAELAASLSTKQNSSPNFLKDMVPNYTEDEFRQHFQVSKSLYDTLCKVMERSDCYRCLRHDKRLSVQTHIAAFLWFAGHEGCSYRDVSKQFDLSISSVCRVIHRASIFLSNMASSGIDWPDEELKQQSSKYFANKSGFDKAIGCIGLTRIIIDPPLEGKEDYIDDNGHMSLCLQGICNEDRKFINVFIGYPGSCEEYEVLQNSPIYKRLQTACEDYYLLGDSAYPCSLQLITPYRNNGQLTRSQEDFNARLKSSHVAIQHCFGILKERFRQLKYCKIKGIEKLCHFIMACCVVHNIADENDLEFAYEEDVKGKEVEFLDEDDEYDDDDEALEGESSRANLVRDKILQHLENFKTES